MDYSKLNSVSIIMEMLKSIPPCDCRLRSDIFQDNLEEIVVLDSPEAEIFGYNIQLDIEQTVPKDNKVICLIEGPDNVPDVIRNYQTTEETNNDILIDPKTGKTYKKRERQKFEPNNVPVGRAIFKLDQLSFSLYRLSFSAEDLKGRILYYNVIEDNKPETCFTQAFHQLFGNIEDNIVNNSGEFYKAFQLLKGEKLKHCRRYKKPEWIENQKLKTISTDRIVETTEQTSKQFLKFLFSYAIPGALIVYSVFVCFGYNVVFKFSQGEYVDVPLFFGKLIVAFIGTIICVYVGNSIRTEDIKFKIS